MWEKGNSYKVFTGKSEAKRPVGITWHKPCYLCEEEKQYCRVEQSEGFYWW
jgi:hypothetical protein